MLSAGPKRARRIELSAARKLNAILCDVMSSMWFHHAPWPLDHPVLEAVRAELARAETRDELARLHEQRAYPHALRRRLHERGVWRLLAGEDAEITFPHLAALNHLTAEVDAGLAITVGVNALALLPIYLGADDAQLSWVKEKLRSGAYASLLLTERGRGSNLLAGETRAVLEDGRYRLSGEKYLINGGREHQLLVTFARTRARSEGSGRSDFTVFLVERDATTIGLDPLPRLPAPAADISGVRFEDTQVPVERRLGKEGSGFGSIQKTLSISRGGIGALAAGLAFHARSLAETYARSRNIYGQPILALRPIAEHLEKMRALELLIACASLKAAAMVNAHGLGAAHSTAVAKYICCALAEELVTEGRHLYGGSGLLNDCDYSRLIGDVTLYGVFDGTRHLMLDQLQWRLAQSAMALEEEQSDPLAAYRAAPAPLIAKLRETASIGAPAPLRSTPGAVSDQPLLALAERLFQAVRALRASKSWDQDQALRFEFARIYAHVEALFAALELADPVRREHLGMRAVACDEALLRSTVAWIGLRTAVELRAAMLRAGLAPSLDAVESALARI